jgi:predicted transcriptional regulator
MSIVVTLSPELEEQLRAKAARQGQDINLVAAELLASLLEWEMQDSAEAIAGIQQGLDEFRSGKFRSFDEYMAESHWEALHWSNLSLSNLNRTYGDDEPEYDISASI